MPLYVQGGKLVVSGGKLGTAQDCCCECQVDGDCQVDCCCLQPQLFTPTDENGDPLPCPANYIASGGQCVLDVQPIPYLCSDGAPPAPAEWAELDTAGAGWGTGSCPGFKRCCNGVCQCGECNPLP